MNPCWTSEAFAVKLKCEYECVVCTTDLLNLFHSEMLLAVITPDVWPCILYYYVVTFFRFPVVCIHWTNHLCLGIVVNYVLEAVFRRFPILPVVHLTLLCNPHERDIAHTFYIKSPTKRNQTEPTYTCVPVFLSCVVCWSKILGTVEADLESIPLFYVLLCE